MTAKRVAKDYNALNQRTKLTRYQSTGSSNLVASTDYAYDSVNPPQQLDTQAERNGAGWVHLRLRCLSRPTSDQFRYRWPVDVQLRRGLASVGADHAMVWNRRGASHLLSEVKAI